jgi:hypothetical protein
LNPSISESGRCNLIIVKKSQKRRRLPVTRNVLREEFGGSQGSLRVVDEAVFVSSKWSMTETVGELEGVQFPSGALGYVVGVVYQTRD